MLWKLDVPHGTKFHKAMKDIFGRNWEAETGVPSAKVRVRVRGRGGGRVRGRGRAPQPTRPPQL